MAMGVINTSETQTATGASVCCADPYVGSTLEQIAALDTPALLTRFRKGVENLDRRMFWLKDPQLDSAFLPTAGVGRWPVRVLLGHLADAELAYAHRLRRTVAEEHPLLSAWDENAFIDAGLYKAGAPSPHGPAGSVAGYVAVIHTLRQFTAQWLAGLTEDQLNRRAMHPEKGELSVRDMIAADTWHLEHHARFLRAKLDRMLGPEPRSRTTPIPAPAAQGTGCCGQ